MPTGRARSWFQRGLAVALGIAAFGPVSDLASRRQCETATAHRIGREIGSRDVFVLPSGASSLLDYPRTEETLRRAGLVVRPCELGAGQFNCFPWAGVAPAEVVGPFLVDVRWGFVAGPLSGFGARTRYFAFFGWVFPIGDFGDWAA